MTGHGTSADLPRASSAEGEVQEAPSAWHNLVSLVQGLLADDGITEFDCRHCASYSPAWMRACGLQTRLLDIDDW